MSPSPPDIASCCAVIVTWQPELASLLRLVTSLHRQQCLVRVLDNGSANVAELAACLQPFGGRIVFDSWPDNRGLASGLNAGLLAARAAGQRLVFLFDQDSLPADDFCAAMLRTWADAESHSPRVAAIGPRLQDPDTGRLTAFRSFRWTNRSDAKVAPGLYETDFLISSGTLLSTAVLDDIGLMKASYFIDNVDLEWCFRAKAKGYVLYGCDAAVLSHRIGEDSTNPLVRAGLITEHGPLRSYYSTRNRLHLRRQNYAPSDWKRRDAIRFALKTAWLLLFSARRLQYLRQIRRAIRDAREMP
jgi:rhamnosyltransferase